MKASQQARQTVLVVHILCSVGLFGMVATFLLGAIWGVLGSWPPIYLVLRGYTVALIVPLSVAALISGLVSSSVSIWGLFRHYWVVIKLVLTVASLIVLVLQLPTMDRLAKAVAGPSEMAVSDQWSLVFHSGGGLFVLLVATALSVLKPRGLTRYGSRKTRNATDAANEQISDQT